MALWVSKCVQSSLHVLNHIQFLLCLLEDLFSILISQINSIEWNLHTTRIHLFNFHCLKTLCSNLGSSQSVGQRLSMNMVRISILILSLAIPILISMICFMYFDSSVTIKFDVQIRTLLRAKGGTILRWNNRVLLEPSYEICTCGYPHQFPCLFFERSCHPWRVTIVSIFVVIAFLEKENNAILFFNPGVLMLAVHSDKGLEWIKSLRVMHRVTSLSSTEPHLRGLHLETHCTLFSPSSVSEEINLGYTTSCPLAPNRIPPMKVQRETGGWRVMVVGLKVTSIAILHWSCPTPTHPLTKIPLLNIFLWMCHLFPACSITNILSMNVCQCVFVHKNVFFTNN